MFASPLLYKKNIVNTIIRVDFFFIPFTVPLNVIVIDGD